MVIEKKGSSLEVEKRLLGKDLKLIAQPYKILLALEKDLSNAKVGLRKNGDLYEVTFLHGCTMEYGARSDHFFQLFTLGLNLNLIDKYTFEGGKSQSVHTIFPSKYLSNNIDYQVLLNYKDPTAFTQIILNVNKSGKIRKITTERVGQHLNFIHVDDGAERASGLCFRFSSLDKRKWQLCMDKFEINYLSGTINIIEKDIFVKTFDATRVTGLCTKSIIEGPSIRLLVYPITNNVDKIANSWSGSFLIATHATFYHFRNESLITKYNFPFNFGIGLNGWGGINMFMGVQGESTIFGFNDIPEDKGEGLNKMINSDKVKYGPVFYCLEGNGNRKRNALKQRGTSKYIKGTLDPNEGCRNSNGDFYFPCWSKSDKKLLIVNFKVS